MCKRNHKSWDKIYVHEKVEIEHIAKALTQTPYKYSIKEKKHKVNNSLNNDDPFVRDEMDTQELIEELSRLLPGKKQAPPKIAKFFIASGSLIPNLFQRQRSQSSFCSSTRENQTNAISLQKNLATF